MNMHKYVVLTFAEEILGGANIRSGYEETGKTDEQHLTQLYQKLTEELLVYTDTLSKSASSGEATSQQERSLQKKVSTLFGLNSDPCLS